MAPSVAISARYEEQLHDLGVVAGQAAELRQLLERPGVRLVLREEIAQRRLRELAIADRPLGELLGLRAGAPLRRQAALEPRARAERVHELSLATRRAPQVLERAQDVEVLGIDRERLRERVLGPPLVVELVAPPPGETDVEIHPRRRRQVLRGLQRARQRLGGLAPSRR